MPDFLLGKDAKLYRGVAGATATTLLDIVQKVTVSGETAMADVTTRANSGFKAEAAGLKTSGLTFDMVLKPNDAGFVAVRDAWVNGTQIALKALTRANGEGIDADYAISKFERTEDLEQGIMVSVEAKLTKFRAYIEDTADGSGS